MRMIETAEMEIVRGMAAKTVLDRGRSEKLTRNFIIDNINDWITSSMELAQQQKERPLSENCNTKFKRTQIS